MTWRIHQSDVLPVFTGPEAVSADKFFPPWSEPVRQKIVPALAIALAASGPFAPIIGPIAPGPSNAAPWLYPWSEPKRFLLGVESHLQQATAYDTELIPRPDEYLHGWLTAFGEPVRSLAGLAAQLQQTLAYHPRLLPNPNVTATMSTTETNSDVFSAAVNVYDASDVTTPGTGAKVSIVEVAGSGGDPVSIHES